MPGSLDDDAYAANQYRLAQAAQLMLEAYTDDELREMNSDPDELRRRVETAGLR